MKTACYEEKRREAELTNGERGIYNMRVICQKLGLSPETLRAWERRYDIVHPTRNEMGHRLYSERDLQVLSWLVERIDQGFTIGQAVQLYHQTWEEEASQGTAPGSAVEVEERGGEYRETLHLFLQAGKEWRDGMAERVIDQVLVLYGMDRWLGEWLADVQGILQQAVKAGELLLAQKRFLTGVLHRRIGAFFPLFPAGDGRIVKGETKALLAWGPEGEPGDLPLLACSLFLRRYGVNVQFLGIGVSAEEVLPAVQQLQPTAVLLSLTRQDRVYRKGEWERRAEEMEKLMAQIRKIGRVKCILLTDAHLYPVRQLQEWGGITIAHRLKDWENLLVQWRAE